MRLQKASICGLYATLEIAAHPDRQVSAAEIATKYGISLNHLAKVLRALVRARLVESVRGASGGYRFCANPKRITLLDIIELFEDVRGGEPSASDAGSSEKRALDGVLRELDEITVATLRSVSITTLLQLVEKQQRGAKSAPARASRAKAC